MKILLTLALIMLASAALWADDGALTDKLITGYRSDFGSTSNQELLINAITNNKVKDLALNRAKVVGHNDYYSFKLEGGGITNQKSSGRCWIFAGMNVFSPGVMTKLKLSKFEFSESYLAFWDKMEKSNMFLEEIIALRKADMLDRRMEIAISSPFGDGGWWNYATALVEKYGVVPETVMPETKQSSATGMINKLATLKLRAFAAELRRMHTDGKNEKDLRKRKESMLSEIYRLMVYHYGHPPTEFVYRYKWTDKKKDDEEDDNKEEDSD